MLSILLITIFFKKIFDKIFKYEKYYINKEFIPIDIEKKIIDYEKIK